MRSISIIFFLGCIVMVGLGFFAYLHLYDHFHKVPAESSISIYNNYYFVPYVLTGFGCLVHAVAGISWFYRMIFSSMVLGMSIFTLFFVNSSAVGHDFGHVIYGGCMQSVAMGNLIISFNLALLAYAITSVVFDFVVYYKSKMAQFKLLNGKI